VMRVTDAAAACGTEWHGPARLWCLPMRLVDARNEVRFPSTGARLRATMRSMSGDPRKVVGNAGGGLDRRQFLTACSVAGLADTLLPGALLALASQTSGAQSAAAAGGSSGAAMKITAEMIDAAAALAGISVTGEQKSMMLAGLKDHQESVAKIRALGLPNSVAPAYIFDPVPHGMTLDTARRPARLSAMPGLAILDAALEEVARGRADEETEALVAFATVRELAEVVERRARAGRASSVALTKMYLGRLRRLDPKLHCVITLTEERALKQAAEADAELLASKYRGPLHGIPWGAKDLLAVRGYPTTWGAGGFERQLFDEDAEVVKRLDAAGAVLIAKLSLGALAMDDLWGDKAHAVRTRNPWNLKQGSSGSSAGSASATSAGCVGFSIGTETLGSISSPSTRCGVTGLRPSFGLVPRTGAMALSWTMDKIGPICRSVEDCALVLGAIYGPDGRDLAVRDAAFNWDAGFDWKTLRVGYLKREFDPDVEPLAANATAEQKAERERNRYDARYLTAALAALKGMGVTLMPVELPKFPFEAVTPVLEAEAAAAFDELTRSGRDGLLAGQGEGEWPNIFRVARFYSAVDYVQAMRARSLAIAEMAKLFAAVDVIVTPQDGLQLIATNLTGNPAVIVPNGIRGDDAPKPFDDDDGSAKNEGGPGTPVSLTFLGALYSDARVAAFARAYQEATGFHRLHPHLA
jgi:Asp-tRNA(Asn)/Glu-tRNA(Gln) amidotransferase A subunit family amidase